MPVSTNDRNELRTRENIKRLLLDNVESARMRLDAGQCGREEYITSVNLFRDVFFLAKPLLNLEAR